MKRLETISENKDSQAAETLSAAHVEKSLSDATRSEKLSTKTQGAHPAQEGILPIKAFVALVAMTHGLCEIAGMAGFMYAKETLLIAPQTMQLLAGIVSLPWSIKPIFGYLVDKMISKTGRTRPIFLVTAALRIGGYSLLAHASPGVYLFYTIGLFNSIFYLFENIIAEYILVVASKRENEENGTTNSNQLPIYFGFRAFGSLIGGFFGGRIVKYYGNSPAFFAASLLPGLVLVSVALYKEPEREQRAERTFRDELRAMGQLLGGNKVLQLIIFVSLINMQPNFDSLITFYFTDHLKFTTEDLANFATFGTSCYILGLVAYSYYFKKLDPKKFYIGTNFLLWLINLSFMMVVYGVTERMGIDNRYFCLFNQGFFSFVAELNFMPLLAIWCNLCPPSLEATSITLFTGLINLSSNLSNYLGALFMYLFSLKSGHYEQIGKAVIIQNIYLFVLIVTITFVPFPVPPQAKKENQESPDGPAENANARREDEKKIELVD